MLAFFTGLFAGTVHVVAGPDHLAAVAPIAAENPKRALGTGFKWGLGHGLGAMFIGLLAIAAKGFINVEMVSAWMEFLVGFMLIGIGMWAWRRASKIVIHVHEHQHDEKEEHKHIHVHDEDVPHEEEHKHSHAALYVGALHGAAGTGHLLAGLPALALPTFEAILYLSAYFIGAVLSMSIFGYLMGFVANGKRLRSSMYAAATASIAIGAYWLSAGLPA